MLMISSAALSSYPALNPSPLRAWCWHHSQSVRTLNSRDRKSCHIPHLFNQVLFSQAAHFQVLQRQALREGENWGKLCPSFISSLLNLHYDRLQNVNTVKFLDCPQWWWKYVAPGHAVSTSRAVAPYHTPPWPPIIHNVVGIFFMNCTMIIFHASYSNLFFAPFIF